MARLNQTNTLVVLLGLAAIPSAAAATEDYRGGLQVIIDACADVDRGPNGKKRSLLQPSVDVVRAALKSLAGHPDVEASMRLMGGSRGHDRECLSDLIVPPGVSIDPIFEAEGFRVKAFGPRPLADALAAGASDLPRRSMKRLVLVTTGGEQCDRDPCVYADELRAGPGLGQVDVLLYGGDEKVAKGLACIGKVHTIKEAKEITAFVTDAWEALTKPATLKVEGVIGKTRLKEAGVEVFVAGSDHPIRVGRSGSSFELSGGRYSIRVVPDVAVKGLAERWRRDFELAPGSSVRYRLDFSREPAQILVRMLVNGYKPLAGTRIFIHRPGEKADADPVLTADPNEPFEVPAGSYDLRAHVPGGLGGVDVWQRGLTLGPGDKRRVSLNAIVKQGGMRVRLTSSGARVEDATVIILPNGQRAETEHTFAPNELFHLPVGRYTVKGEVQTPLGSLKAFRDNVPVEIDKNVEVALELPPAGHITFEVVGARAGDAIRLGLMQAGDIDPGTWLTPFQKWLLPATTFDVLVERTAPHFERWWARGVKVVPGRHQIIRLKKSE